MRSQSQPNKIDCALCKKTVGLQQIRDDVSCFVCVFIKQSIALCESEIVLYPTIQMPPHIRKMFQNTEKMIDEAVRIYEFQQGLSEMALANMVCRL